MAIYRIEISPNKRAGCQGPWCKDKGEKIQKGETRLGVWVEIPNPNQGGTNASFKWRHWGCATPAVIANLATSTDGDVSKIDGIEDIPSEIRSKIEQALKEGKVADEDWKGDEGMNVPGAPTRRTPKSKKSKNAEAEAAADAEDNVDAEGSPEPRDAVEPQSGAQGKKQTTSGEADTKSDATAKAEPTANATTQDPTSAPLKRKRGRPRKEPVDEANRPPKRPRGRPRKEPGAPPTPRNPNKTPKKPKTSTPGTAVNGEKRPRGRPRKTDKVDKPKHDGPKRGPGRPRKDGTPNVRKVKPAAETEQTANAQLTAEARAEPAGAPAPAN